MVAEDGTWSLTDLDLSTLAEGEFTYKVTVTDSLGNVTEYELEAVKDTVAPTLAITEVTDPIEVVNVADVDISGTGEAGATITVVVSDGVNFTTPVTAIVDSNGDWSITGIDVSDLSDGTLTFEVSAEDQAGNVTVETIEATKSTVAIVSLPDAVNQENEASVTISGTGQSGASVVVVVSDGTNEITSDAVVVDGSGNWSVTLDLSSLDDGELSVTATLTAGEDSVDTAETTMKDTVVTGSILAATATVNSNNDEAAAINGTAEIGSTVELTVIGGESGSEVTVGPISAAVAGDGTWSLTGINVSSLPDGPIRYEVKVTDGAGNEEVFTQNAQKDTVVALEITTPDGSEVNAENAVAFQLTGTRDQLAALQITVSDGTNQVTSTLPPATVLWSRTLDLSSLDDGTLTVTVIATDLAGNVATEVIELLKDTQIIEDLLADLG
jgi:hypothetical protein